MDNSKPRQRRRVRISICLPVLVDCVVERIDEDDDWTIASIRDLSCQASPRGAMEAMGSPDFEELAKLANAAKDET